jgi:hypothetical protein
MKYLRIVVTKTSASELYVEVPDDFNERDFKSINKIPLREAILETIDRDDWDSDHDSEFEWEKVSVVKEDEAKMYPLFKLNEEFKPPNAQITWPKAPVH